MARWSTTPPSRSGWWPGARHGRDRRRRRLVPRDRRPARAPQAAGHARSRCERPLDGRHLRRTAAALIARRGGARRRRCRPRRHRLAARRAQCAERRGRHRRGARRVGRRPRRDPRGPARASRAWRTAWSRWAAWARAVRQRFQGDQRRRRGEGARRLPGAIYWIAGGLPKEGGIDAARAVLPARRQGLPDRRGDATPSPRRSGGAVPVRAVRHAGSGASATPRRDAGRLRRRGAGRAAVAGLRLLRPVSRISRCAATPSATVVARHSAGRRRRIGGG